MSYIVIIILILLIVGVLSVASHRYHNQHYFKYFQDKRFNNESLLNYCINVYYHVRKGRNTYIKSESIIKLKYKVQINGKIQELDYNQLIEYKNSDDIVKKKFERFIAFIFLQNYSRLIYFLKDWDQKVYSRNFILFRYEYLPFTFKKHRYPIIHPAYFLSGNSKIILCKWLINLKSYNIDYFAKNPFFEKVTSDLIIENITSAFEEIYHVLPREGDIMDTKLLKDLDLFYNENRYSEMELQKDILWNEFVSENGSVQKNKFTDYFI